MDLAVHLKCPSTSSSQEIVNCLRGIPKDQLTLAQFTFKSPWYPGLPNLPFGPVAEPEANPKSTYTPFLTKSPIELLVASENEVGDVLPSVEVPWLAGVTEHEGSLLVGPVLTEEKTIQEMDSKWSDRVIETFMLDRYFPTKEEQREVSEKFKKFYFGGKSVSVETAEGLIDLSSDAFVLNGVYKSVKETVSRGKNKAPVYLYQYAYNGPISIGSSIFKLREEEKKCIYLF